MQLGFAQVDSPLGLMSLATTDNGVCALGFADQWPRLVERMAARFGEFEFHATAQSEEAAAAIAAYFEGELTAIDALAVDVAGTNFQQRVWRSLRRIPVGETCSYQELAADAGAPKAVRAAGTANGANLVAIVIPCHRVIRSGGGLGGYGGGLDRKARLLQHEGAAVKLDHVVAQVGS